MKLDLFTPWLLMNAIKLLFIFFRQRHYRNEIRIAKCGKHLILKLKNIIQIHSKVATKVWILESILDLSQRIGVVSPLVSLTFWVISSKSLPSSGWHSPSKVSASTLHSLYAKESRAEGGCILLFISYPHQPSSSEVVSSCNFLSFL